MSYLDRGPAQHDDPRFEPTSAMLALVIVDRKLGSNAAARFLQPGGLWDACTDDDQLLEQRVRFTNEVLALLGDRRRAVQ